jgi:hypothetical protein
MDEVSNKEKNMNAINKKAFIEQAAKLISTAVEKRMAVIPGDRIWFSGPGEGNYFTPAGGVFLNFRGIMAELICHEVGVGGLLSAYTRSSHTGEGWKGRTPLSELSLFVGTRKSYKEQAVFRNMEVEEALRELVGFSQEEVEFLLKEPEFRYLTASVAKERLEKLLSSL